MTGTITVGRAQWPWGEYYGPIRIHLWRDDFGVIWLMDVPPLKEKVRAGVEETLAYARKCAIEVTSIACYKPELLAEEVIQ